MRDNKGQVMYSVGPEYKVGKATWTCTKKARDEEGLGRPQEYGNYEKNG